MKWPIFARITSFPLSREIIKLVNSLNQLTPDDEVYDIKVRFNEETMNNIEITTQQVSNKTNSVKLIRK